MDNSKASYVMKNKQAKAACKFALFISKNEILYETVKLIKTIKNSTVVFENEFKTTWNIEMQNCYQDNQSCKIYNFFVIRFYFTTFIVFHKSKLSNISYPTAFFFLQ